MRSSGRSLLLGTTIFAFALAASAEARAAPAACSEQELARLLESAALRPAVSLTCSALLKPTDVIQKRVVIRGSAASGLVLDCRGATLHNDLLILSRQTGESGAGAWDRPERITVRNCVIEGHLRVSGMAINGEAPALRDSSRSPGHSAASRSISTPSPLATPFPAIRSMRNSDAKR
jgi:hypothetical protein